MLGIGAANRDERVYADAEEFRLDRSGEPEHLAFGAGPHLCLGNHLHPHGRQGRARGGARPRSRPDPLRLADGFEWECVDHMLEYGPERLDVVVAGGAAGG